ncbi:UNKNOWN [Stylonychia lemnae]|uniref:Transmembrane protein n=1 Tax=Stylonychia lemnae TaxID=5949 RepID=A0A077ZVN1_STYLE|nr:UNKNOWN [Stylonychia lemnae]|eukprot:CDW73681.1 UNKNOWN [Stylonychia lemnae]
MYSIKTITLLCILLSLSFLVESRRFKIDKCDYKCKYMCISDQDQEQSIKQSFEIFSCPVKCGCAPYPFQRNVTQCEKYCILFSESNDCIKCYENKLQQFEDEFEQNILKEEGDNKQILQDQLNRGLVAKVEELINEWKDQRQESPLQPIAMFQPLNHQIKDCITLPQLGSHKVDMDIKCALDCKDNNSQSATQLCSCLREKCIVKNPEHFIFVQQSLQQVHDPNSSTHIKMEKENKESEQLNSFIVNSIVSLVVTAMLVSFVGYVGMKIFQSYQQKQNRSDNLLENDYLRLNGENYQLVGKYNTYPNTSDPNQIKALNEKAKLAKKHYLSPNTSMNSKNSLRMISMSGSYHKIDEEEKEYEEDEEGFKKLK